MTDPGALPETTLETDILIVGGGLVGLSLARALAEGPWRTHVIDRQPPPHGRAADARALAIAYASKQTLATLAAWDAGAATPIDTVLVSQRGGGRTLITAADAGLPALGFVMRYADLSAALAKATRDGTLTTVGEITARTLDDEGLTVDLTTPDGPQRITARLVVHAEGTPAADSGQRGHDYDQHAVVCTLRPRQPHAGRAWERFTPEGPLALLPLGPDYALVMTVDSTGLRRVLALDDAAFLALVRARFGPAVDLDGCGPRSAFPLAQRARRHLIAEREVWIGNAAQTLHPVAGQGFNLGLRDASELAARLNALAPAADPGAPAVLAAHARARRLDREATLAVTDGLVRLFAGGLPPWVAARGLGLAALDLCPPLRRFVARRLVFGARALP